MCCQNPTNQNHLYNYFIDEESQNKLGDRISQNLSKKTERQKKVIQKIIKQVVQVQASSIFVNGIIYTMNQANKEAQAMALVNNKIVKVGKQEEVLKFRGFNTRIIDLNGKTVLPGFIDPHIHMCFSMIDSWIDLGPFVNCNMDQVRKKLQDALLNANPKRLVAGQLFDPQILKGHFDYSLKGLDKLSQNFGIFILQSNAHVAHVNSAAFKLAGIDKNTEDPPHGRLIRNQNGQLTGQIQQTAVMLFKNVFPLINEQKYAENFKNFLHICASKGCTGLHDCGIGLIHAKADLSILYHAFAQEMPVRYSGFLVSNKWKTWKQLQMKPENKDKQLRINGIKSWADGSTQGGTAYLRSKYLVQDWGNGKANYKNEDLYKTVKVAHDEGWQVGIHSNGDAAIDLVLDVYEKVQLQNPKPDIRHRIEHCTICHKQQLERMANLKIHPSFLIGHIYYYGQVFQKVLGKQVADLTDPLKSAFDYGLKPTIHSDYNCQPVDPLRCIHNAVTRIIKQKNQVLNQKQCVTPYQAIQAMTINAAWQCHKEDIVGSIQEGKLADFVILDQDPLKINPLQILKIKILATFMDGKITYQNKQSKLLLQVCQKIQSLK